MDDGAEKDHELCRVHEPDRDAAGQAGALAGRVLSRYPRAGRKLTILSESASPLSVDVWRGGAEGRFQTFAVPRRPNQTVLDVVTEIQRDQDPTLAYRFACRVGMCGSCAMVVNGRPRWTCRTRVSEAAGP